MNELVIAIGLLCGSEISGGNISLALKKRALECQKYYMKCVLDKKQDLGKCLLSGEP